MVVEEIAQLIFSCIALLACSLIGIILIREFHCAHAYIVVRPARPIFVFTYIALVLFSAAMIASIATDVNPPTFAESIITDSIITICWCLAELAVFSMIVYRTNQMLMATPYQLTEANYVVFSILVLSCFLLSIVWILRSFLYRYQFAHNAISTHGAHEFSLVFIIIVQCISIAMCALLIRILRRPLKMIAVQSRRHPADAGNAVSLHKLAKYWVLSLCFLICSQCVYLLLSALFISAYVQSQQANKVLSVMFSIALPLSAITASVCALLMFETYQGWYGKICGRCHQCAEQSSTNNTNEKPMDEALLTGTPDEYANL